MLAFTAILFFCFTDMIQMKEIQSSKVFHLIKCRTEINRWVKDVSLKELSRNLTMVKYSVLTNKCTSYTSNAACFVEQEGNWKFSILQFYTDNTAGNTSYVCVKRMIDLKGMEILTTLPATLTLDPLHIPDAEKVLSTSLTPTVPLHIPYAKTVLSTSLPSTVPLHIPDAKTVLSTSLPSTGPLHIPDAETVFSTSLPSTVPLHIPDAKTVLSTSLPSTVPLQIPDAETVLSTSLPSTVPIHIPGAETVLSTSLPSTDPSRTSDSKTNLSTIRITTVITVVTISGLVILIVVCVFFRRKLKRQGALNINASAIGGAQSNTEVISSGQEAQISSGQEAQISSGQEAQTTIGANSGTDFAVNMELSQINQDGEPFPCHGEVSFLPTAVDGFRSSGTAGVLHPDPHISECQNSSPSQGLYAGRSLDSVDENKF